MNKIVFTIGHSTHKMENFLSLLSKFKINSVVDVRSSPYSRIAPQYNKSLLSSTLKENNIHYLHFEKEFGARQTNTFLLDENNKVDFSKVRETDEFKNGITRVRHGISLGHRIVLMCSEAMPFDCHRFVMISYQLAKESIQVDHILKDGTVKENFELENWLLNKYHKKIPQNTIFETITKEQQLEVAYELRNKDIAFTVPNLIARDNEDWLLELLPPT